MGTSRTLLRYGLSAAVHGGIFWALVAAPRTRATHHAMVAVVDAKRPKPREDEKKPQPPKPADAPKAPSIPRAAPKPAAPAPLDNAPPRAAAPTTQSAAMAALPDFGLALGGTAGGGIAVPTGAGGNADPAGSARGPRAAVPRPRPADDGCAEEATRPKPLGMVQPSYTDAARAAGVEGRVRVSLSVDASGAVTSASVVSGLGHGLDEAAVAAAKRMKFSAATKCGKGVDATFVVSMRFVLGE